MRLPLSRTAPLRVLALAASLTPGACAIEAADPWPWSERQARPATDAVSAESSPPGQQGRRGMRTVVIDPGHGGRDPGAVSPAGVREKDVTLAFALELAQQLRARPGYAVKMTRRSDQAVPLRHRVATAQQEGADLFVSIHADAAPLRAAARGLSVYTLSEAASGEEAAALAARENTSGILTGVDLEDEEPDARPILIDMSRRETKNVSARFAAVLLDESAAVTDLLTRSHRFAGFRVLTAPEVPAVLVELGFLTNAQDVRRLTSPHWRERLAGRFVRAIDVFFAPRQP